MNSQFLWLYEKKQRIINMSRLYKKPTITKKKSILFSLNIHMQFLFLQFIVQYARRSFNIVIANITKTTIVLFKIYDIVG